MKGRTFMIELYPDTTDYNFDSVLVSYINWCNENDYSYFYILHDKDEETKPHYHFLITIKSHQNDRTLKTVARVGGIAEKWVEKMLVPKQCILYLCHLTSQSKDKYHYDWHDIKTNNDKKLKEVYSSDEEQRHIYAIIDYIDSVGYISFIDFSKFILSQDLWSYYRRSGAIINNVINEHNKKYVKYTKKDEILVD